ncbi:pantoate--beta-alanine ligase [Sphingomonas vulcanisoli]|uniref:Pantothenate synthetase n=1 Tax=Sphingomonas vulcanisoli TaxID=1658060 RepID=A0ABX0TPS2_9SPHN|nr:pantoate--beta-alanine ligase [Sphingomonas vulcanisoli]NIJ07537.1 pantoate--beta-alanine ligase [Sphingomonas vulcanisoli]
MEVVKTVAAVRAARGRFPMLGLVPTMGFLHAGHISLVERAKAECGAVAVSIFVNPTQFAAHEDLGRYPRDLPRDLALLEAAGADLVFTPGPADMYPDGFQTRIELGPVTEPLEGAVRPGHFAGVATVVAKLFNIVQPTRAYFGQKDAQQCVVVRRMVRDLDMPVEVVVAPTVREADGLAMSSRNAYLNAEERAEAPLLYRALSYGEALFAEGERDAGMLRAAIRERVEINPRFTIDYVSVADAETLEELERVDRDAVISLAARLGTTRLIDNVVVRAG